MEPKVRVEYKNDSGEIISEREYQLSDYTNMIKTDLFRIISDVESLYYRLNDGKAKSEWSEDDINEFNTIKHKLLDKAGEIERLPSSMTYSIKPGDGFITRTFLSKLGI